MTKQKPFRSSPVPDNHRPLTDKERVDKFCADSLELCSVMWAGIDWGAVPDRHVHYRLRDLNTHAPSNDIPNRTPQGGDMKIYVHIIPKDGAPVPPDCEWAVSGTEDWHPEGKELFTAFDEKSSFPYGGALVWRAPCILDGCTPPATPLIQLDDLLPFDSSTSPRHDSGTFFDTGSPFWEFSDVCHWDACRDIEFRLGWMACLFETLLKSGRSFTFPVAPLNRHWYDVRKRAERYDMDIKEDGHNWVVAPMEKV